MRYLSMAYSHADPVTGVETRFEKRISYQELEFTTDLGFRLQMEYARLKSDVDRAVALARIAGPKGELP